MSDYPVRFGCDRCEFEGSFDELMRHRRRAHRFRPGCGLWQVRPLLLALAIAALMFALVLGICALR